jgi:tetratricopeptide (TPR) repeat protein
MPSALAVLRLTTNSSLSGSTGLVTCARARSGHAAAPKAAINSRRFIGQPVDIGRTRSLRDLAHLGFWPVRLSRLALSIDDGDPETLALAALTSAFMVGDSESEIEMADRAVALNPNSFAAWNCRGQVYRIAGLPEEALRSWERAVRMSPVDPRLHLTFGGMGYAFIELRRFDEAIVAGKKALRQNPSYATAYRRLAAALAHLGRDAEAREAAARINSTLPLQYLCGSRGAGIQTRSC